jgi:hypothetical protein
MPVKAAIKDGHTGSTGSTVARLIAAELDRRRRTDIKRKRSPAQFILYRGLGSKSGLTENRRRLGQRVDQDACVSDRTDRTFMRGNLRVVRVHMDDLDDPDQSHQKNTKSQQQLEGCAFSPQDLCRIQKGFDLLGVSLNCKTSGSQCGMQAPCRGLFPILPR